MFTIRFPGQGSAEGFYYDSAAAALRNYRRLKAEGVLSMELVDNRLGKVVTPEELEWEVFRRPKDAKS